MLTMNKCFFAIALIVVVLYLVAFRFLKQSPTTNCVTIVQPYIVHFLAKHAHTGISAVYESKKKGQKHA